MDYTSPAMAHLKFDVSHIKNYEPGASESTNMSISTNREFGIIPKARCGDGPRTDGNLA